jgi:hypothetical protein
LIVLASLIGAMTLVSTLLLALEPRPVAPRLGIALNSLEQPGRTEDQLFQTNPAIVPGRWSAIVIHDSGFVEGTAHTLNRAHEKLGIGGLGYHFVIENDRSGQDGGIVMGFRWRSQLVGAHSAGPDSDRFNRQAIGICLIGDLDRQPPSSAQEHSLVWLVQQLQQRFNIPRERVYVRTGTDPSTQVARFFPDASFRRQLMVN